MRYVLIPIALMMAAATSAAAWQMPQDLESARGALTECLKFTDAEPGMRVDADAGKAAAGAAERAFRAVIAATPSSADAHAGLGEVLARCALQYAGMTSIMNVADAAIGSLQRALQLDGAHWQARFMLAMVYLKMPSLLNRGPDAIRELETLRAQQGTRADLPHYALTWLRLGDAYASAGRQGDARAAWAGGARLFPANEELKLKAAGAGSPGADAPDTAMPSTSTQVIALAPLRVDASQYQLEDARSTAALRRMDIMMMPGGTGEMLQTLQALPGTTRAGDGADLYVRGGDPEETPIFVNGGRMAFAGRWESFGGATMGVLDASVLSKAYFSAGAFSARYGNALSGIVDVETHGRPQAARGRVGVNLVSVGGSGHLPAGARAGMWGTAIVTDVSLLARMQGQADQYPDMPRSLQAVTGGAWSPRPSLEVKAVALLAQDESARLIEAGGWSGPFRSTGGTQHGGLSTRWLDAGGRAGVTASLSASRRAGTYSFGVLQRDRTDRSVGARVDGDVVNVSGARVRSGLEFTAYQAVTDGQVPITPSVAPDAPVLTLRQESDATHTGAYIEVERPLGDRAFAVIGVRADRLPELDAVSFDPRAAVAYLTGAWTLRAGAGVFQQGGWRRRYQLPDAGVPSGVATRAKHAVLAAERAGEPSIRVEAFSKMYDRFRDDGGTGPMAVSGSSRGIDAIVRWQQQARLNGWITYSVLDADLDLVDGTRTSARYDVTHTATAVGRYALSDSWELGSTVRYATGKPFTPVVGAQASGTNGWPVQAVHGEILSERLPYYGRLDARMTRYQRFGTNTAVIYLEMLDLTGRRNVLGYQYNASYTERVPVASFFARRTFVAGAEVQF